MEEKKAISMTECVYRYVKEQIIYGGLLPGDLLNERVLGETLKLSKTPVREALQGLIHEGLVEVIPYKGYFVKKLSFKEIRDLFEVRIILESQSIELVALRATPLQISNLKELASQKITYDSNDAKKNFLEINANFHTVAGDMSGNIKLAEMIRSVINQLQPALFQDLKEISVKRMEEEHLAIVTAVEQKNGKEAKKLMIQQLQDSQIRILNSEIIY